MISQKMKEKLRLPTWETIQELIDNIQSDHVSQLIGPTSSPEELRQTLCYRDLCGNDIAYHLVVNNHLDFLLKNIENSLPFSKPEHNQIIQSVIKGLIKIKNRENSQSILEFLRHLLKILKPEVNSENTCKNFVYLVISFDMEIFIDSHFNYQRDLKELQLLITINKLIKSDKMNQEKYFYLKQNLEFKELIISKKQNRRNLLHLDYQVRHRKKLPVCQHYSIYRQICENQRWDKIVDIPFECMFELAQDGFSPYMKMLQKAPFEILEEYHKKNFDKISIQNQYKDHGYNVLHCISENKNIITLEFINILKRLNQNENKINAYFDQIPLVFYIDKQKCIQDQFVNYLSDNKQYQNQEGLQIIAQLYAKQAYDLQGRIKPKYKRLYKKVEGYRRNRNKKVKSLYKKKINKDQNEEIINQSLEIYQQIVQLHKIHYAKGTQQQFEISQYSFSDCHLQYQIYNVEKPIIVWSSNVLVLRQFIKYIENDFAKQISVEHTKIINALLDKLNLKLTIQQLILTRKVIILNSVLKQFEGEEQLIKEAITRILKDSNESFEFAFISYSKFDSFQDYLLFNNLIDLEQYQYTDAFATLKKLLKLGYTNVQNLRSLASKITPLDDQIPIESLFHLDIPQFTIQKINIYKGNMYYMRKKQEPFIMDNADQELFIQFYVENLSKWTLKQIYQFKCEQQNENNLIYLIQLLSEMKNLANINWAYITFKRLVYNYILIFENFQKINSLYNPKRYNNYQNRNLYEYFLRKNDIRTVEQILINFSTHKQFLKNVLESNPLCNYHIAFSKGWWLGLNLQQFEDLIDNNEIKEEEKNQILGDLSVNGQCEKLKLVVHWAKDPQIFEEQLAIPAFYHYQQFSHIHGLRQAVKDGYTKYRYNFFLSFEAQNQVKSNTYINSSLFSSSYFQTDFAGTAQLLSETYKGHGNVFICPGYHSLSQILFPRLEHLAPDPDGRLLREIFDTVTRKEKQQHWDEYLQMIEKNIDCYNDGEFKFFNGKSLNLSFIFEKIEINSKRGQFFKKVIDILIKAKKLENTLNEKIVTGPKKVVSSNEMPAKFKLYLPGQQQNLKEKGPNLKYLFKRARKVDEQRFANILEERKKAINHRYLYRRSQYLFNATRFDYIKKNRFAIILEDHFQGVSFETLEITERIKQIYYGLPFENLKFNEVDLFISLMSRRQSSIVQILSTANDITETITKFKIIQYLIIHGGEQTVIEVLNLVKSINLEWFYYKSIPLLSYIVFKKWYKLYSYAEKYIFDQWILQQDILQQGNTQLSIHQFATLNQFYVQFTIPFENQFLARTCQFLIPKQQNLQHKSYKIYLQFVELFPYFSRRDLEIFCLQTEFLEIQNAKSYLQLFNYLTKQKKMKISMYSLLTLFTQNPDKSAQSLNCLLNEIGQQFETNLAKMNASQVQELYDQIYQLYGVHHPTIEEIIKITKYFDERILDSPRLSVLVAQSAEFEKLNDFLINQMNPSAINLRNISRHLMKIITTLKYGQEYELLDFSVHLKYYVDALNLIEENQQGSISQQFLNQFQPQLRDHFYPQILEEPNQIKRAFKLIIRIKQFNYELEQIKQIAIAKTDYLIKEFKFEISDHFGIALNKIFIPCRYEEEQLKCFLETLPSYFQDQYKNAVLKRTSYSKGLRDQFNLIIKFEEQNLSNLYNDMNFLNSELRLKAKETDIFVYNEEVSCNPNYLRQLLKGAATIELLKKYSGKETFFNRNVVLSKQMITSEIQRSIYLLKRNFKKEFQGFANIEIESFSNLLLANDSFINKLCDIRKCCDAIANYPTLLTIINYSLGLIESIIGLFSNKCFIKFELVEEPGVSPHTCVLDQFFSFGSVYLNFESGSLFYVIQVCCKASSTPSDIYLETVFNGKQVNKFLKNHLKLEQDIDGLIYRHQIDQLLSQACNRIKQQTNLNFILDLDIRQQIQQLDYQYQTQYLKELQIYLTSTIYNDFNYILQGPRIEQYQQNQLLSLHQVSKPLNFGCLLIKSHNKLRNRFGILQRFSDYQQDLKQNDILHICYCQNGQIVVKFCKFQKILKKEFYYEDFGVGKKKNNSSIPKENILYVIRYTRISGEGMITFIDNDSNIYLISQNDQQNVLSKRKQLTTFPMKIIFSKDSKENELIFEDFRQKDPQESQSKINVENMIPSHKGAFSFSVIGKKIEKAEVQCQESSLLRIFSYFANNFKERSQQLKTQFHYVPCFYKILSVERDDILGSSSCLDTVTDQHLMKFSFPNEEIDEGEGAEREYFTQLGIELKNQEKKYFAVVKNSNHYFISTGFNQENGLQRAYALGLLLAYSIANQLEMGISFALPFWKVIIGLPIEFDDLEQIIDRQSFQSYQKLKTLNASELQKLELTFMYTDGKELCQNGSDKIVNNNNLDEYLQLTAKYIIYEQHKNIFDKIIEGFKGQWDPQIIINHLSLNEINQLIDHSYYQIDAFWFLDKIEYVNKLNYENFQKYILSADSEKLKLLIKFASGSMIPQEDVNGKIMKVSFYETNQNQLPTANTCYREISVPVYSDYETLSKKLDLALELGWNYFGLY